MTPGLYVHAGTLLLLSLFWQHDIAQAAAERVSTLEAELRRAKRREEKLAALQFRLREDLRACGGDLKCAPVQDACLFLRTPASDVALITPCAAMHPDAHTACTMHS